MEKLANINAQRILWCCEDYSVTPEFLSQELKIAPATFDKVLDVGEGFTFNQLKKVADFFGRGVLFFLEEGGVVEEAVHTPQFRTIANDKPNLSPKLRTLIEKAEAQREAFISLRDELGTETQLFEQPDIPRNRPKAAAGAAREWLGVGDVNDFTSYRDAIAAKGILVFRSNGYAGKWQFPKQSKILGFNLYREDCPLIVVRKENTESRQAFTLMHELGHILLHQNSSIDDEADMAANVGKEREANLFAAHMLIPDSFLATISDHDRPANVDEFDDWLSHQRRQWGVSTEAILLRLVEARRLDREVYAAYRTWTAARVWPEQGGGSRAYRHREPIHLFGNQFVALVFSALSAERITIDRASRFLDNIKLKDIRQLEDFYAGI